MSVANGPRADLDKSPRAPEMERDILGRLMVDSSPQLLETVRERLNQEDDFLPTNRRVFEHICKLADEGKPWTEIAVIQSLEDSGDLPFVGGKARLGEIVTDVVYGTDLSREVEMVVDARERRRIIRLCNAQMNAAIKGEKNAERLRSDLRSWLSRYDSSEVISLKSFISSGNWPDPLAQEAYHGLAGEIVRAIEPHSEADPVALLMQTLIAFGSVINRSARFMAECDAHYCNLFAVLVGLSSKGRKGTSLNQIRRLMSAVDEDWESKCVTKGMSSGEGLIWEIRDKIEKMEPVREKGRIVDHQKALIDEGVKDKRLLVVQTEFAQVLKMALREGNILSEIIRQAWESGDLRTMTKNTPARATDAHISIIGHITKEEINRCLNNTEASNGFGNRFLWLAVGRSKLLPEGGEQVDFEANGMIRRLRAAVDFARVQAVMKRDDDARKLWRDVYTALAEGKAGLLGAITARSEAMVARLSVIYALLDCSPCVRIEHLKAALAVWVYSEQSAAFIFGDALGDPTADEILQALRQAAEAGLTRTQVSNLFNRNRAAGEIGRALGVLRERGLARCIIEKPQSDQGRSVERWQAVVTKETNLTKKVGGFTAPLVTKETNLTKKVAAEAGEGGVISSNSFISSAVAVKKEADDELSWEASDEANT
jgi:hypothetical protein